MIEVCCETCFIDKECKKDDWHVWLDDYDEPTEESFCLNRGLLLWSPKIEHEEEFCFDCPMRIVRENERNGCARHAEPCWKNPNHGDMDKWNEFLKEYKERMKKMREKRNER